jgi:membrane-bound serine protease (ClpP class)
MRRAISLLLLAAGLVLAVAPAQQSETRFVAVLTVDGAIGPATSDYLRRGLDRAAEEGAQAVVLKLDTPGGLVTSTRDITSAMLASEVPIIGWVAPDGARAASAGTFIIYASHLAAMAPTTTMGAATPVSIGGGAPGSNPTEAPTPDQDGDNGNSEETKASDKEEAKQSSTPTGEDSSTSPGSASERKAINDTVAYILTLAERYGRNADFAERAVREAATVTASEALDIGAIELVAADIDALLEQADGREVRLGESTVTLSTSDAAIRDYAPDWRTEFLSIITDPQIAYFLLIIGLYGLLLEGYNPGGLVPGVIGGVSLLIALYALQLLPVNYAGLLLILLGVGLITAELFAPSFGILGIGGLVSMGIGFVILIDSEAPGMDVPVGFIIGFSLTSALVIFVTGYLLRKALRMRRPDAAHATEGRNAIAMEAFDQTGPVRLDGEIWRATTNAPVSAGQNVRIIEQDGLTLRVEPLPNDSTNAATET